MFEAHLPATGKLKEEVTSQLYWDARIDASDIRVEAEGSTVILTGSVPSLEQKRQAEVDAYFVGDVISVDNRLEVKPPRHAESPKDHQIEVAIRHSLAAAPGIDSRRIVVGVSDGRVALSGKVGSTWQKRRTAGIAEDTAGVVFVRNDLEVVPEQRLSDEAVQRDIVSALARSIDIDDSEVHVTVRGGIVTLSGKVRNYNDYRMIEDTALYTRGVVDVVNSILIDRFFPVDNHRLD